MFRRCSGISPKFARRFAEGIRKLAGTRWEIVGRTPKNSPSEYRRLPDWWDKSSVSDGCTAAAQAFG
ncbi:hypothetical protein BHE74_00044966 [Ensete ventricosum]|nr:hypothetical protein GW17_00053822 [Ensete ventricosum]RWW48927.1 hypothetical protein BHE74_00044966 [Ensete ventricosum]RZS03694.1 hypothetical protein BHM03_00033901 [Ensete ventricosum]